MGVGLLKCGAAISSECCVFLCLSCLSSDRTTMYKQPPVESNAALYSTWDEEWRGRVEFKTEMAPEQLSDRRSQRLLTEYRTMRSGHDATEQHVVTKATEDVIEAAEAAIEQGAFFESIQVLTDAIDSGDTSSLLLLLRGQSQLKQGDPTAALLDLDACIRSDPWFPEAYISRGRCYQALQDFHHAVNEFNKGMQITEQPDAQLFFELGDCSAAIQQNKTAAGFFQKAIDAEPTYAIAYWRLADVLAAEKDFEGAEKNYARVCQTDTQVHLRYLHIAEEDMAANKWAEAIRTLDAVEKIQPGDFRVFWQRANCHISNSPPDFARAFADISKCIELDPLREDKVFMVRGRCSIEMGDWHSATQDVTRFLQKDPDSIEGRLLRAKLSIRDCTWGIEGTEAQLKRCTANLAVCKETAQLHHASQQEEDDALAALAEAESLFEVLTERAKDETSKRSRAVMDYDHVVKMNMKQKLGVALVKSVDNDADFCIAKVGCYEDSFDQDSDAIKDCCDRFFKAWCQGIQAPLQTCVELVVAEKLLDKSRKHVPTEEDPAPEFEPVASLRSMCASKLVESGKYGGRKLPAHFHRALAEYYLKQSKGADFLRTARHLTMGFLNGASMRHEDAGFCAYTMHMARTVRDGDGKAVVPKLGTLVQQCAAKIAADGETFSNDLQLMNTFREQYGEDTGKKGKK